MLKQITFLLLLAFAFSQLPEDDEVFIRVPGYNHTIYSGYLHISQAEGHRKSIHYVYFQSQSKVTTDPLIISLTGGPGCSSMNPMLLANGPFIFKPGAHNLTVNPYAWNKRANLVYLQLPAGVGFSWRQKDEIPTDEITVTEAISAMITFFIRFPRLTKNQLYLTGTGYGAIFASLLAKEMIDSNKHEQIFIDKYNIKGVLLGNPCVKKGQCYASSKYSLYHYEFLYKRGFASKTLYNEFRNTCGIDEDSVFCFRARTDIDKFFNGTSTSIYNVYDKCYNSSNSSNIINTNCLDEEGIITYLNDHLVQEEWNILNDDFHVEKWTPCNHQLWKEYLPNSTYVYEILPQLLKNHQRIWIYSGDLDSFVPTISTKKWIEEFKSENEIPIKRNWREWWVYGKHKGQDQVGGMVWELDSLTFASVKGAGFRSSIDQPAAMEQLLNGFLDGRQLRKKNA